MSVAIPSSVVIDQGADFYLNVTWLDPNGAPYNLTGYTATFTLRQDFGKPVIWTLTESFRADPRWQCREQSVPSTPPTHRPTNLKALMLLS
jgi:hypothetical protein